MKIPVSVPKPVLEDARKIRNRMIRDMEDGRRVFGFTAATHGEGTTFVLLSLALAVLEAPGSVLLVDATSEAGLTKELDMQGLPGLAEYSAGASCAGTVHRTGRESLAVLPSGIRQDGSAVRPDWTRLLGELRGRADFVFLDLPPLLDSAQAADALGAVDGVVLVVQAHKVRREVLRVAHDELERCAKGKLFGAVLNGRRYYVPEFLYRRV